jgi:hypothetical protein
MELGSNGHGRATASGPPLFHEHFWEEEKSTFHFFFYSKFYLGVQHVYETVLKFFTHGPPSGILLSFLQTNIVKFPKIVDSNAFLLETSKSYFQFKSILTFYKICFGIFLQEVR